jgi:DNA/RNA-binding domain of Phe-tRNA-synthetase-like protein
MTTEDELKLPFGRCNDCGRYAFPKDRIVLSVADFEALQAKAAAVDLGKLVNYRRKSRTRISRNPTQAEFVLERLPTMTVSEVFRAFNMHFGEGVVSRSQLYRFAMDMGLARHK